MNLNRTDAHPKPKSVGEVSQLSFVRIEASSDGLGWSGFHLEIAENWGCDIVDVTIGGHYVVLNLADEPLYLDSLIEAAWISECIPPGTFWIVPEDRPVTTRHDASCHWAGAMIDGAFLDSIAGRHHELRYAVGAADPVLARLMESLMARVRDPQTPNELGDVDTAITRAFVLALARRHGHPAAELPVKGGIAAARLKLLLSWVDDNLDTSLTIEAMASRVELSAAHFSREFKRSTGMTPWGHVVELRLQRARRLLEAGETIGSTARKCGFSDRSHLSRQFRQRFGLSPIAFAHGATVGNSLRPDAAPRNAEPT